MLLLWARVVLGAMAMKFYSVFPKATASDYLVPFSGHSLEESYLFGEMHSVYFAAQTDWAIIINTEILVLYAVVPTSIHLRHKTDHLILARRTDFEVINGKKKRTWKFVDFADHRIKLKECEKKDKYLGLPREFKKKNYGIWSWRLYQSWIVHSV